MTTGDTRERIMASARLTVQDRGYAGLSFRELAKDVGIKSASIHHYFPTKGELGGALAELLAQGLDQATCMQKYADVFGQTLRNENRMCLGGIMAAEHTELPEEVQAAVVRFGEMNVEWIAKVLSLGRSGDDNAIRRRALAIFTAIQGAQLVARSRGDATVYDEVVQSYREAGLLP
jgi:TetR/AcrR family transcriptional repressor of nem operon